MAASSPPPRKSASAASSTTNAFPHHAIAYCLEEAGLTAAELDYVGFYDKPLLKFERLLETYLAYAPQGFRSFVHAMPLWLRKKLYLPAAAQPGIGGRIPPAVRLHRTPRVARGQRIFSVAVRGSGDPDDRRRRRMGHRQLSASDAATGSRLSHELHFPHSLGLLYSAFTYYCGFKVNSGEYKLMGLAPYGEPEYVDADPRKADRHQRRRLVPDGHVVLQLLPGADDDLRTIPSAVRRAAAPAGIAARTAAHGHRRLDPGGHRRDHARDGARRCTARRR